MSHYEPNTPGCAYKPHSDGTNTDIYNKISFNDIKKEVKNYETKKKKT
jgi:hypothetical protein